MKKSQLIETIRTIVKSKLNKIKENNDGFSSAKYGEDSSSKKTGSDSIFGLGTVSNKSGSLTATLLDNGKLKIALYNPGSGGMPIRTFISSTSVDINNLTPEFIKDFLAEKGITNLPDESIQSLIDRVNTDLRPKLNEGPDGLWKNIRDKRERGEKPARKNSEAYKKAVQAGKRINSEK